MKLIPKSGGFAPKDAVQDALKKATSDAEKISEKLLTSPKAQQMMQKLASLAGKVPNLDGPLWDALRERLGLDPEAALGRLRKRLQAQFGKHPMIGFGADIVHRLLQADKSRRFAREILLPASQRRLRAAQVWSKTGQLLAESPCSISYAARADTGASNQMRFQQKEDPIVHLLRQAADKYPGWTMGIGMGPECGALVVGAEQTLGFAGMLHGKTVFFNSRAVTVGAAEMGFALEVSFSPCAPTELAGVSFGVEVGYAFSFLGVGITVGYAMKPKDFILQLLPFVEPLPLEEFDSITVGVPVGVGVEAGFCVEYTTLPFYFPGPPEEPEKHEEEPAAPPPPALPLAPPVPDNLAVERAIVPGEERKQLVARLKWEYLESEDGSRPSFYGFHVERAPHGAVNFARIGTVIAATQYEDPIRGEHAIRDRYDYRVQAFREKDVSDYSNIATWRDPSYDFGRNPISS